jgi:hypothetical protein
MDPWTQLLFSIISGVVVAIVTSLVTVHLSLRRFYSERWWERKAEAYSSIIESLHHVKNNLEALMDAEERGRTISEDTRKQLADLSAKGYREVEKATSIGAFIISDHAANSLMELRRRFQQRDPEMSWYNYLESRLTAIDQCLVEMRTTARKDLKVQ